MSAPTFALLGVVGGALLAGGADLLLAWRKETIEARAGVHIIRSILEEAKAELDRLIGETKPRWAPGRLPDSRTWDVYRSAVSARLPLAILQKIDKAMRDLDSLNAAAARAIENADQHESRIWTAAMAADEPTVEKLAAQPSPEILTDPAEEGLERRRDDVEAAYEALLKVAPVRPADERRTLSALLPWSRWHWRSLAISVLAVAIAAGVVAAAVVPKSQSAEVQDALSAHLHDPALTACEPVEDYEDRFSCVAVEEAHGPACQANAATAAAPHRLLAGFATPADADADSACGAIDRALEYSATRRHDTDCIAFLETAVSEVPATSEQKKPGFLARLKAKLNQGTAPRADVPPVIAPGTAFVADC